MCSSSSLKQTNYTSIYIQQLLYVLRILDRVEKSPAPIIIINNIRSPTICFIYFSPTLIPAYLTQQKKKKKYRVCKENGSKEKLGKKIYEQNMEKNRF